ncbi:MAG: ABC transporter permease [Planctomycetia bacterium]|nr:ABC transporter permease [Planctomycetia bacterium]
MKKLIGSLTFMLLLYAALYFTGEGAFDLRNHANMARQIGQLGILCLGAGTLIIAGGIDLSMGSFIGLCGAVLAVGLSKGWHPAVGIGVVCTMGVVAGTIHGLLVTKLKVQAFIVTLCGLFIYRGLARWWTGETNAGLGGGSLEFRYLFNGARLLGIPIEFVYLLGAAALAGLLLHRSIYGRYLFAIGSNELAAKYSGISVDAYKILAYVACSLSAVLFSILKLAETGSVPPSNHGASMELYAIAGAVLGGCSLRGGEGNVIGIVIGAVILVLLNSVVNFAMIPQSLEYTAIGSALLLGAILDEALRRRSAVRKG